MQTQATALHDTEEWAKGERGQDRVSELLKKNGWYVIDNAAFCGRNGDKAPRLRGRIRSYVTPDLLICKADHSVWLECKTKQTYTVHELTGRKEHGFALRYYRDYLAVQQISGIDVWVCVYEEDSGKLLFGLLEELAHRKRIYPGDKMDAGGTIFFLRTDFQPFQLTKLNSAQRDIALENSRLVSDN